MGTYTFLDTKRLEHRRKVFNIVALLSMVGGLAKVVFFLSDLFCSQITFNYVVEYYVKTNFSTSKGIYKLPEDISNPKKGDILKNEDRIGMNFTVW